MDKPLLTALIFAFHHEERIARCIDSILFQKTDYSYVIHLHDDCSQDNTPKICAEYAQKYPDKIKFFPQKENTFLGPYEKTQTCQGMQNVDTKYFCIIEADDYWCNENKIQMALDFLESHPDYSGFAHDTLEVVEKTGTSSSFVHDVVNYGKIENPVCLDDRFIFLLPSSRIFRNYGFKSLNICPVDYLVYYFHLEKGPIHYHDEIMSVYTVGKSGVVSAYGMKMVDISRMFPYRINKMLNFKQDEFCTSLLRKNFFDFGIIEPIERLLKLKKIFGVKLGWHIWFFLQFVPEFGLEAMNINYVFSRKFIKDISNKNIAENQKKKNLEA